MITSPLHHQHRALAPCMLASALRCTVFWLPELGRRGSSGWRSLPPLGMLQSSSLPPLLQNMIDAAIATAGWWSVGEHTVLYDCRPCAREGAGLPPPRARLKPPGLQAETRQPAWLWCMACLL